MTPRRQDPRGVRTPLLRAPYEEGAQRRGRCPLSYGLRSAERSSAYAERTPSSQWLSARRAVRRRRAPPTRSCRSCGRFAIGLAITLPISLAIGLSSTNANAYPTSIVFAPNGEALAFGGFTIGAYSGFALSPQPVHFSSALGGIDVGVLPSVDIVTTPAGTIAFAGAELGFDVLGPDADGKVNPVFNAKIQLLKEATYWPAISVGFFQISSDPKRGARLGYFSISKSFTIRGTGVGQLTFGMMQSFADGPLIAPQCFVSGARSCLFRGSEPFLDGNGAFLAGYLSPWIGPVAFAVDYVGGTSAVSSTNVAVSFRLWQDGSGGFLAAGLGGFFSNDRREAPPGPGAEDGMFVSVTLATSLAGLFGWDPTKEWSGTKKGRGRSVRGQPEDPFEAPPLTPPTPTTVPDTTTPTTAPDTTPPTTAPTSTTAPTTAPTTPRQAPPMTTPAPTQVPASPGTTTPEPYEAPPPG